MLNGRFCHKNMTSVCMNFTLKNLHLPYRSHSATRFTQHVAKAVFNSRTAGGTAIFIHRKIPHCLLISPATSHCCGSLCHGGQEVHLSSTYISCGCRGPLAEGWGTLLENYVLTIATEGPNSKHPAWNNSNQPSGYSLVKHMPEHHQQVVIIGLMTHISKNRTQMSSFDIVIVKDCSPPYISTDCDRPLVHNP